MIPQCLIIIIYFNVLGQRHDKYSGLGETVTVFLICLDLHVVQLPCFMSKITLLSMSGMIITALWYDRLGGTDYEL